MSMYGRPPTSSAANRPTSRIGTSWGRGAAPTTAAGTPAGFGVPPRTGGAMMPPTTARMVRPGTSSLRNPSIMDRPGTQQGVGGMPKTSYGMPGGSGRAVQDRSFWVGELKQRLALVNGEINKMISDIGALERENTGYAALEKRGQALGDELRELQGQLGDYNMLFDKLHSDADLEEVQRSAAACAARNEREQQAVDALFMERQEKERKIKELEQELKAGKDRAADQVAKLDASARDKWTNLESTLATLQADISTHQSQLTTLQSHRAELESTLHQDPTRMQVWTLQDRKHQLATKLVDLQSPPTSSDTGAVLDTKEAILDEIKRCTGEIAHMERTLADLAKDHARIAQDIAQLEAHAASDKAAKYDELVKKDKEMQAFLDAFPAQHAEAAQALAQVQNEHLQLLSDIQALSMSAPAASGATPADLKRMAGDLKEKEKELATAESTVAHVAVERERLVADLQQIDQLEGKIAMQLAAAKDRILQLKAELDKFAKVDEAKVELTCVRDALVAEANKLREAAKWARLAVTAQATRVEVKRGQLAENDTFRTLAALEAKWRGLEMSNSGVRAQVAEKAAEADYQAVREEVGKLVDECLGQNAKMVGLAL
ncbi:hypothetical protein BCR44DRAFT_137580 [Catenaria anguillulae PL171]|uniref:Uncharacterized protein n=1 Tax=Catenaria anguillulae PL171 TaxID=765915 RepID=A0A1Y2HXI9_9FUNG|nr:hypothetical protein BCR44DRAFT_137580 [Catenaria anguillulae PL171]